MSETMLKVEDLVVRYGPVVALRGISLEVARGEVVALVGANGAGKSTLLKTLSGLMRPVSGSAHFKGLDLSKAKAHNIVKAGLVHVPEGRHVFPRFSLRDNLLSGAFAGTFKQAGMRADSIIKDSPILARRAGSLGGQLSGGEQQMLVIQRALMGDPTMILLDEPSMGLSPLLVDQVLDMVADLRDKGMAVLLVEQNALAALEVADRAYALGTGQILMSGPSAELRANSDFADQFLGVVAADAERTPESETTIERQQQEDRNED